MKESIEELLISNGVLLKGHFLLTSGLHSEYYFEKFRILENPKLTVFLCSEIVEHFTGTRIEKVVGPTTGGIILAYEVARQMGIFDEIAEEQEKGKRIIRRGSGIREGEKVLIVDDVLTTGGSLRTTINAVKEKGGEIVGLSVLIDRSMGKNDFGYPLFAVYKKTVVNYSPEDCPLCKKGIPLMQMGGHHKNKQ